MTVALVTGAGRGLGLEICRQLADLDLEVILTAAEEDEARHAAERLWDEGLDTVHPRVLDVTSDADAQRLRELVEAEFGRLHVLVNNARVQLDEAVTTLAADLDLIRETLEVNTLGALRVASAFVPVMKRSGGGRIVNVSSAMGAMDAMSSDSPGYRLSKVALNALTRMLASELDGDGILVNSADPGPAVQGVHGTEAPAEMRDAADTIVWLATLPDDGPTGGFFRDRRPIAF